MYPVDNHNELRKNILELDYSTFLKVIILSCEIKISSYQEMESGTPSLNGMLACHKFAFCVFLCWIAKTKLCKIP